MAWGRWKSAGRAAAAVLAVALLAAAVYAAAGQVEWATLRDAGPAPLAGLALAVLANLLLTGALFWAVTRSFEARPPVGLGLMLALIAASSLLNYLPLRPGLLGRAAYLKLRHDLPIAQSVVILLIVLALSAVVLGACTLAVVLGGDVGLIAATAALLALSPLTGALAQRALRRQVWAGWLWVLLRLADMFVAGARLWLAFAIVDAPVSYTQAVAMAAAGLFVSLTGLTPNGLGLREWVIAALVGVLAPVQAGTGLAAALVDRAAEALVCVLTGLPATLALRAAAEASKPSKLA